ncbi:30S ribosomal protein S8 [Bdellovibrio bacteriovorus]|jgi:small subunit ribosomal protein S8|uniref:Small ribosomal subunit protein uS8 n=2 Tax=Bdellovibrio bacteriovorus TaxID=959 RepID=RS8_BDEBA|nr:30S ribosomal protein S8 [Bdellovibrio bacteriovorus]Q6MJ26.1 RecName: Full=Small ribosomal subunit protein uS8; AltName: Full=30S ribosomal protein S8 [Bdellovibrio bacteriovorus HD100]AHZ83363.1 30S ribosomal protein S8 [Bdellovibrio bacteriovorus]ASD62872.1 30S ribosomal protein S8 [Bdellovibrio bacteriovorus]UXR64612.1 30S ribosomal protein S8 [Bdellovibrio bacteriovorus]CAE80736.1 30S ribosomal protein S8 [Bdellovibrio bacteriovorus HD100]BEV69333.1 30S ribosomal protein S8 [Bdellovib
MDTISQFLTMIRNAGAAKHEKVDMPASKVRAGIAQILVNEGFIRSFKVAKDSKQGIMRVYLKYDEAGGHAINNIDRVSRPGRRVYVKSDKIPTVRSGMGMSIISTSKGIMSGKQATEQKLGGELLATLW